MGVYKTVQGWNGIQIRFVALILACFFAGLFALVADTTADAVTTVPTKMNFQGRIANSGGNILANGTYNMKFRIWSAASGGTQQWSEDRLVSAGQGVTVTNGQFSVQLGGVTSLPASVFASSNLYFEVELPTPASATTGSPVWTEGPMTPRNQLATSAYAYNSETLDGLDSAAFGQLDQNNVFTGNNTFNGTLQGGSSLTLGTAATQGSLVLNDGNGQTGTLRMADTAGNYTYTIPVATANDTFCLQTLANCAAGSGVTTVGALDGGTANATGASIVGSTLYLQSASATNAGLVNTTNQSFAGNKTFTGTVAVSGTTSLNDNVTIAANKTIQLVGGLTSNRPASPAEGTVYFDTDTKKLEVYANGKWQADRSDAVLVAASNSSQSDKDAADYVTDGNTGAANDGDQVQINAALTAGAGRKVVLLAGTYVVDTSILVPNTTTLAGIGNGTTIELADIDVTDNMIENSDTTTGTGITIRDMNLNGRNDLNTGVIFQIGIYLGGVGGGSGGSLRVGPVIENIVAQHFTGDGISLYNSNNARILGNFVSDTESGVSLYGTTEHVVVSGNNFIETNFPVFIEDASDVTYSNNTAKVSQYGFYADALAESTITGNVFDTSSNAGMYITGANNNIISANTLYNSYAAMQISGGPGNIVTANTIKDISTEGVRIGNANNSVISNNTISNSGGAGANEAITLTNSDSTNITGNVITDTSATTTNYAINISDSFSDATYLADNTLGGGSINNAGTGTIYAGQVDASGNLTIQPAANINLNKDTVVSSGSLTLGTSSVAGGLKISDGSSNTGTISMAPTAGNYTYTIPVTTANDTFCLQTSANCALAVGTYSTTNTNANGATMSGNSIIFQNASATAPGMVGTGTQTFAGNKTFSGTVTLNDNVTVAATKVIQFVGGATGTRPVSPGEGAVYYDQTTKQLLTYTGTRWQSDGSDSILVAASNSSQADKDVADYVADGDTAAAADGDQVQINTAIAAATGKKVVLLAGTYVVDATILIPNNTTLTGVGDGTLIELSDIDATDNMIENSDTSTGTGVTVQNLRIDGRSDLNTVGAQTGIRFTSMGGGAGSTARKGGMISNINVARMRTEGIEVNGSLHNTITSNYARGNGSRGFYFPGSSFNTITNNISQGNTAGGYLLNGSNNNSVITNNMAQGNGSSGFAFSQTNKTTLNGNTSSGNTYGIFIATSPTNNVISGNTVTNNTSGGISVGSGSDGTSVTGNSVTTTTGTGIDVASDNVSVGSNTVEASTSSGIAATGDNPSITGNVVSNSTLYGISINSTDNATITGNRILNSGAATTNNGIFIFNSDNANVSGNSVTDTSASSNNYAINVNTSTSDSTYLSGNTLGGGSINNAGTATIYVNQVDASGNLINRNQGGMSLGKTTAGTTLDVQGAIQNIALSTPTAPTLSTSGTAGSTTYGYRVAALDGLGETLASTETTIGTGNATLTSGNYINITWPQVGGAVQYKVYRSTSAGTPSSLGLIRTVAGNVLTTTDTGIAASGSVAASNTTGGASFGGAMQGGSSLSLGTASVAGALSISDGSSNTATIAVAPTAGNYTYTIPVTTASDTFCMQTLANCAAGGGVSTIGALDGGTPNANGATIVGSIFYLQSASTGNAGLVNTAAQSFTGSKTFTGNVNVGGILDVTAGSLRAGTAGITILDGNGYDNSIVMAAGGSLNPGTYSIPLTSGPDTFCLETLANCSSGGGTLQTAYDADVSGAADIITTSSTKTFQFKAGSGFNSSSLFDVQNATSTSLFIVDSTNNRVYVGDETADATGTVLVLDTKNNAGDPTGVIGAMYYNSALAKFRCYEGSAWQNCSTPPRSNSSTATQAVTAGTDTYLTNSSINIPSGGLQGPTGTNQDGTLITWRVYMSKTNAGTAASTFNIRFGTNGTTADTARCTAFSTGTATAAVDGAVVTITAYATAGGAVTTLNCSGTLTHQLPATGFANTALVQAYSTAASFSTTTANTKAGLSFNAGTSSVITIQKVEVTAVNL